MNSPRLDQRNLNGHGIAFLYLAGIERQTPDTFSEFIDIWNEAVDRAFVLPARLLTGNKKGRPSGGLFYFRITSKDTT